MSFRIGYLCGVPNFKCDYGTTSYQTYLFF